MSVEQFMRNLRTKHRRRIATAAVIVVSFLSLIVISSSVEADNTKRRPARSSAASLSQGAPDQGGAPALDGIADKIRKIETGLVGKGQAPLRAEEHIQRLRSSENPLEVANPLLRDIRGRLNRLGGKNEQFQDIQRQDTQADLDRIGEQLDNYNLELASLGSASNTNTNTTTTEGEGTGFSLLGLGQMALAFLSLPALLLAAGAILLFLRMRDNLSQVRHEVRKVATAVSKIQPTPALPSAAAPPTPQQSAPAQGSDASAALVEQLTKQVREQQQSIALLTQQLGSLENRAAAGEKRTTDSLQAVEQVTRWLGRMHMRGAEGDVFEDESERAAALDALERYDERLRANAALVEPLTQAIANLVDDLEARTSVAPELLARVQRLYHDIGQFDQWAVTSEAQLNALRRGSMDERRLKFQSEQRELGAEFKAGRISFAQYVEQFRRMLEHHFPAGADNGGGGQPHVAHLSAEQLTQYVEGAPEYLMDWFSTFSQLQSQAQAAHATGAGVDSETLEALAAVQTTAREVLNRFDIQPEEIYVGRTSYDRHLHDAAMIRQTSQFPANTVIEVHRAGFRRVSTGEVLRRPQVVVAGSGA